MPGILDADPVSTQPALEPKLDAKVYGGGSIIRLSGQLLAAAASVSKRRELINRLFSIPDVGRAKVEQRFGAITLWFLQGGLQRSELLDALAAAMRLVEPGSHSFPNQHLLSRPEFRDEFEVHRAGSKLTLWRISRNRPNTLRLFHALLGNDKIKSAVIDAALSLVGVTAALSRRPNAIEIVCQPGPFSAWALLDVIESALAHALPLTNRAKASLELGPALIRANLALAPIADYVFPPLGLANAALVLGLSAKHVGPAARRLAQGKAGLDLLYSCIALCTLTTFTFLPSALMYWLLAFWPQLTRKVRQEGEFNFLARLRRRPRRVLVERAGEKTEVKVHELKPGDVVILKEGDTAPADGVVITGEAKIQENLFTGSLKPAKKIEGSDIYAATQVTEGSVHFRIGAEQPRADRLVELYTAAFARPKTDSQATRIAELLAGPALLLGLAALGRGGIHMTKAVIRPDYFSGAAMAEDFGDFGMILQAADAGIVIMDPNVLDPIFKADYWVFDDTVPWRFTHASEERLHSLDHNHERDIVFLSKRGSQQIVERTGGVRFSRLDTGGSSAAKKAFIAQRQAYGQSVVYFGDCDRESVLAATADVAVMVADKHHRVNVEAPIVFLSPDLGKFSSLHSLCEKRNAQVKSAFAVATIPNVVAIGAAVFLNSPALVSVVMTTIGAATCFHRASRLLRQAAG
jgi:E1-E2 ATPase